jgi:CRISPR-associated protein Csm5
MNEGEVGFLEFFIKNNYVYFISEEYMVKALTQEGLADDFTQYVQNEERPTLSGYLDRFTGKKRYSLENMMTVRKVPIELSGSRLPRGVRALAYSPVDKKNYLPGSSIKGALRTTMLYLMCQKDNRTLQMVTERLFRARRNQKETFARKLDEDLLQNNYLVGARKGANSDWLKTFCIEDAFPEKKNCTEISTVRVVSLTDSGWHFGARGATIFTETFLPQTVLFCNVYIDDFQGKVFSQNAGSKLMGFEELMQGLDHKYKRLLQKDKEYFAQAGITEMVKSCEKLEAAGANFRLGWGSGMLSTTVDLLLDAQTRREIRRAFYPQRNNPEFPQSRRVIADKGKLVNTLGWLNLSWKKVN